LKTWPYMPVEFSVACYRLGHSMIRPGYRLNDADDMLLSIFPDQNFQNALTGFETMAPGRAIDWGRFIDLDVRAYGNEGEDNTAANKKRLQVCLPHRSLAGKSAPRAAARRCVRSAISAAAKS